MCHSVPWNLHEKSGALLDICLNIPAAHSVMSRHGERSHDTVLSRGNASSCDTTCEVEP